MLPVCEDGIYWVQVIVPKEHAPSGELAGSGSGGSEVIRMDPEQAQDIKPDGPLNTLQMSNDPEKGLTTRKGIFLKENVRCIFESI